MWTTCRPTRSAGHSTTYGARTELFVYLDASAIVKLIRHERESDTLRAFLRSTEAASSELAITEVARAVRRLGTEPGASPLHNLLIEADRVLRALFLVPIDRGLLVAAGGFRDHRLRTLDALHVATAVALGGELKSFISYDHRQAAAARAASLQLAQPGI